jgi:hypothetical protein
MHMPKFYKYFLPLVISTFIFQFAKDRVFELPIIITNSYQ